MVLISSVSTYYMKINLSIHIVPSRHSKSNSPVTSLQSSSLTRLAYVRTVSEQNITKHVVDASEVNFVDARAINEALERLPNRDCDVICKESCRFAYSSAIDTALELWSRLPFVIYKRVLI